MAIPQSKRVLIRSVNAQVSVLKRPMVWGSATVVLLASYIGFEYLTHPERLRFSGDDSAANNGVTQSSSANGTDEAMGDRTLPPPEDNDIGADIDSLSLLFSEIQDANGAIAPSSSVEAADEEAIEQSENTDNNRGRRGSLFSFNTPYDRSVGNTSTVSEQGFSSPSESFYTHLFSGTSRTQANPVTTNLASQNNAETNSARSSTSAPQFGSSFSLPPSSPIRSPLQESLSQRADESYSSGLIPSFPTVPASESASETPPLGTDLNLTPFQSNSIYSNSIYPGAASSPLPGTTGYTLPPALRSPTSPYTRQTYPTTPSTGIPTTPTRPSGYGSSIPVPQAVPYQSTPYPAGYPGVPFGTTSYPGVTFPNQTPSGAVAVPSEPTNSSSSSNTDRRYTGGGRNGRINTFSNP